MTKTTLKLTTILTTLIIASAPTSMAQTSPIPDTSAMLILDASGSMWQKIGNQTKIEIARDVVDEMVSTWDKDTPLGLMAYGHRNKGDCSDIEVLSPPAPLDAKAFSKQVRALNPTGKTPMVQSVIEAAEALSYTDSKSTVILVSDGKETCGMDACAMGAALEAKGIDFTAHVIGFDVSLSESAGMRCLADKTGGLYLDAENAEELSEAITVVTEDTTSAPVEDVVGPATVDVVEDSVIGGTRFDVNWTGPENQRDYLMITSPDGETSFHRLSVQYLKDKRQSRLRAPEMPGPYRVHYMDRHKTSLAYDEFTVTEAEAFIEAPEEGIVGGTLFTVKVSEPHSGQDDIKIYNSDGKQVASRTITLSRKKDGTVSLRAPEDAGDYAVKYVTPARNVLAEDSLTVIAAAAQLQVQEDGVIGGTTFKVKVSEPHSGQDDIKVYNSAGKQVASRTIKLSRKKDGMASLRAPEDAGDYAVKYVTADGNVLAEDSLTVIAATAALEAPDEAVIGGTIFRVKVSEPHSGQDDLKIYNSDGKQLSSRTIKLTRKKDGMASLRAPEDAGEYAVKYVTPDKNILAEDSLTVIAATAELDAPDKAVIAGGKFTVKVSEPHSGQDDIKIYNSDGKQVSSQTVKLVRKKDGTASIRSPKEPGRYTVKYVTPKKNILAEDTITVVAEK